MLNFVSRAKAVDNDYEYNEDNNSATDDKKAIQHYSLMTAITQIDHFSLGGTAE